MQSVGDSGLLCLPLALGHQRTVQGGLGGAPSAGCENASLRARADLRPTHAANAEIAAEVKVLW